MGRYLIPVIIFFGLVILFLFGLQQDPHRVPSPLIDKPLPVFDLPRLSEPHENITPADFNGRVVMLNVWASWCVSCRYEHPVLMDLAGSGLVEIYGLNYKDSRDAALGWLQQHGNPYLESAFDELGRVGIDLGVYGVPETYLIDQTGVIRYKHIGPITNEDIQTIFIPLLEKLRSPQGTVTS